MKTASEQAPAAGESVERGADTKPGPGEHWRDKRAAAGIPEEKTCARCGETFTRSQVANQSLEHWLKRRYCSKRCRWPDIVERTCEHCGQTFRPRTVESEQRFCSTRCAGEAK